ncbi:MAG: hypothetical protein NTX50_02505 [Candidatus Sumerlaeota bacterium]|nr:hypothetical protein [Candidatus Sumerlaeota bacterium]
MSSRNKKQQPAPKAASRGEASEPMKGGSKNRAQQYSEPSKEGNDPTSKKPAAMVGYFCIDVGDLRQRLVDALILERCKEEEATDDNEPVETNESDLRLKLRRHLSQIAPELEKEIDDRCAKTNWVQETKKEKKELDKRIRGYCREKGLQLIEPIECDVISLPPDSSEQKDKIKNDGRADKFIQPWDLAVKWLELGGKASHEIYEALKSPGYPLWQGFFTEGSVGYRFRPIGGAFIGTWTHSRPRVKELKKEVRKIKAINPGPYQGNKEGKAKKLKELNREIEPFQRILALLVCVKKAQKRLRKLERSEEEPFTEGQEEKKQIMANLRSAIQTHTALFEHGPEIVKEHRPQLHNALQRLQSGKVDGIVTPSFRALLNEGMIAGMQLADWIGDIGYKVHAIRDDEIYQERLAEYERDRIEQHEQAQKISRESACKIPSWEGLYKEAQAKGKELPIIVPLPDGRKIHLEIVECIEWWHNRHRVLDAATSRELFEDKALDESGAKSKSASVRLFDADPSLRHRFERGWFEHLALYLNAFKTGMNGNECEMFFNDLTGHGNYIGEIVRRLLDIEEWIAGDGQVLRVKDGSNPWHLIKNYWNEIFRPSLRERFDLKIPSAKVKEKSRLDLITRIPSDSYLLGIMERRALRGETSDLCGPTSNSNEDDIKDSERNKEALVTSVLADVKKHINGELTLSLERSIRDFCSKILDSGCPTVALILHYICGKKWDDLYEVIGVKKPEALKKQCQRFLRRNPMVKTACDEYEDRRRNSHVRCPQPKN